MSSAVYGEARATNLFTFMNFLPKEDCNIKNPNRILTKRPQNDLNATAGWNFSKKIVITEGYEKK